MAHSRRDLLQIDRFLTNEIIEPAVLWETETNHNQQREQQSHRGKCKR